MPPEPVVLTYNLNPAEPPPERPQAWDLEIKTEDTALKNRMSSMITANKDSSQRMLKLDEEARVSVPMVADY